MLAGLLIGRELERQLGIKVNTINAARSGNNTQHLLLALQGKLLGLQPEGCGLRGLRRGVRQSADPSVLVELVAALLL